MPDEQSDPPRAQKARPLRYAPETTSNSPKTAIGIRLFKD